MSKRGMWNKVVKEGGRQPGSLARETEEGARVYEQGAGVEGRREGGEAGREKVGSSSSQGIAVRGGGGGVSEALPPQPVSRVSGARHSDFRMG